MRRQLALASSSMGDLRAAFEELGRVAQVAMGAIGATLSALAISAPTRGTPSLTGVEAAREAHSPSGGLDPLEGEK